MKIFLLKIYNYIEAYIVEPLLKRHDTFNLSIKDKFCGPYRIIETPFYLYVDNLCIIVKLYQWSQSAHYLEVSMYLFLKVKIFDSDDPLLLIVILKLREKPNHEINIHCACLIGIWF